MIYWKSRIFFFTLYLCKILYDIFASIWGIFDPESKRDVNYLKKIEILGFPFAESEK